MVTERRMWLTSLTAMLCWCAVARAQQPAAAQSVQGTRASATEGVVPDAQVEANVLKALAASPELADQSISTTAVYGVVTMTGTVKDDALRRKAETIVSTTAGVKRVVDRLAIGAAASSGGTEAGWEGAASQANGRGEVGAGQQGQGTPGGSPGEPGQAGREGQPEGPGQAGPSGNGNNQHADNPDGDWTGDYPLPSDRAPSPPPPPSGPRYRRPYSAPPPPPEYGGGQEEQQRGPQQAGVPVVVPAGSVLRIRIDDGLDNEQAQVGSTFNGIVLRNVIAGGSIAIPRGTAATGTIVEVQGRGRPVLALQITQLMLDGLPYPVVTDAWSRPGMSRTPQAVNNAVGIGAMGALLGGMAGGGGALLGAGLGGATEVGATMVGGGGGSVVIPAEAILTFRLLQPVSMVTVSQAEIDSLAAGVPQVVYRTGRHGLKPSTVAWDAIREDGAAGDAANSSRYQE